jgi:hypothetical protein
MSVTASSEELRGALDRLASMLDADGFELHVQVEAGRLDAAVVATSAACADCLVPKDLLGAMIIDRLAESGIQVGVDDLVLSYPADLAH